MTSLTATALWLDGVTDSAQALREMLASALLTGAASSGSTGIAARQGVRPGLGSPLLVSASSGMNVTVNAGVAFVQGTASTTAGMYTVVRDTSGTITLDTSDPTNPRIDNIIAKIVDNGNNTSTATIAPQTGTPAPSPAAPTLPANSLLLAQIAVAAGTSSITSGNITDKRVATAMFGGIIPVKNSTDQPQATSEFPVYRHRLDVAAGGPASPTEWSTDGTTWNPVSPAPTFQKIGQYTVASPGATMTLAVPSGFSCVQGVWSARIVGATTQDFLELRFNGDTTTAYGFQFDEAASSAASGGWYAAGTIDHIVIGEAIGASETANFFSTGEFTINNYASTSQYKSVVGSAFKPSDYATGRQYTGTYGGSWSSNAAISSITLQSASNFAAGSVLTLYGML